MFQYSGGNLPCSSDGYFNLVCNTHFYDTRTASKTTFSLPSIRSNHGLLNIRFCGPKIWNTIDELFKLFSQKLNFTDVKFSIHRHGIDIFPIDLIVLFIYPAVIVLFLFLFCAVFCVILQQGFVIFVWLSFFLFFSVLNICL